jgi:hypothetical protein
LIVRIISNANPFEAIAVDGSGLFLMPGLIDPQVHITYCSYLTTLHDYENTKALGIEMCPYTSVSICEGSGVTAMQISGAAVNGSKINLIPGFPTSYYGDSRYEEGFTSARVAEGVNYINFLHPLQPDDTTIAVICHI